MVLSELNEDIEEGSNTMHKAKIILTLNAGAPPSRDHFRPKVTLEDIREEVSDHATMLMQGKKETCIRRLKQLKSLLENKASGVRAAQDIVKDIDSLLSKYEDKSDEY